MNKDRYRFTLQWPADNESRIRAGEFLSRFRKKKSDFVVRALNDWLNAHPDYEGETTLPSLVTISEKELRAMLDDHMEEIRGLLRSMQTNESGTIGVKREAQSNDLAEMLDALEEFM